MRSKRGHIDPLLPILDECINIFNSPQLLPFDVRKGAGWPFAALSLLFPRGVTELMRYQRTPIEMESPEELGYSSIQSRATPRKVGV
jgi:hypothetical protein